MKHMKSLLFMGIIALTTNSIFTKSPAKVKKKGKTITDFTSHTLKKPLDNSWGYDRDDKNFLSEQLGPLQAHDSKIHGTIPSRVMKTTQPTVLVNFHSADELHLGTAISGDFVPGKHRSLSWGTPLQLGDPKQQSVSNYHEASALPLEWSGGKHRPFATYAIVPEGKEIEYKIGVAAPQTVETKDKNTGLVSVDHKVGGGIQMRLKGLPEGTILLTTPIYTAKGGKINHEQLLRRAISKHNENLPEHEKLNVEEIVRTHRFTNTNETYEHFAR